MILILDFGSQYTQLIARRIREHSVYCEIQPCSVDLEAIQSLKPEGIILSGGPSSVLGEFSPTVDKAIFSWGIPILGICYGQQLIASLLGGKVQNSDHSEYGRTEIKIEADSPFFADVPRHEPLTVWMSHGDLVTEPPAGFQTLATSSNSPFAAIADPVKKIYGIQFHPEVTHT
ncbi:MAG: glutamine-hydrolyzing GMP synthase, partial [bacterium]